MRKGQHKFKPFQVKEDLETIILRRKAEGVWVVESGEEKTPGTPYCSLSVPKGGL